jgi:hypothetical protein
MNAASMQDGKGIRYGERSTVSFQVSGSVFRFDED